MAKLKKILVFAGVVLLFAAIILIMNSPLFSRKEIQMDKFKAAELAKTDFDKGSIRFIEVYKEDPKVKGSDAPPSGKWVIPGEKEIGKDVLEKYYRKVRIEPDYGKEQKAFKKEEWAYASAYNKAVLGLVLGKDKSLAEKRAVQVVKSVPVKLPPPPPVIIDSGDIPMDKVKAAVLSKTDIERGKIRFIEVFKEDPKKPGEGKWTVVLEKDIGKEILEQYPERIRIEKDSQADSKVFQKNEAAYAAAYNRAVLKFLKPDAAIFTAPPKKTEAIPKAPDEKKTGEAAPPAPPTSPDSPEPVKILAPAEDIH